MAVWFIYQNIELHLRAHHIEIWSVVQPFLNLSSFDKQGVYGALKNVTMWYYGGTFEI